MPEQEKRGNNAAPEAPIERIISYNFNEDERPGGMKIRAKIRVVSGRQAEVVDAAQAEAVRELLKWARQHREQHQ
jgi:hypothetical protein